MTLHKIKSIKQIIIRCYAWIFFHFELQSMLNVDKQDT